MIFKGGIKMPKATQTTGKKGELRVIGELLKRGFQVYTPLVDIGGIDCIIQTDKGYKEIQIKTREFAKSLLFDVKNFKPQDSFFIICYNIKEPDIFWVLPSAIFKKHALFLKKYNRLRLILRDEDSSMRRKLHYYRNNFFQLKEGTEEAARELKENIRKSGWQYLKELYPNVQAVTNKIKEARKKGYSEGYIKVLNDLKRFWEKQQK